MLSRKEKVPTVSIELKTDTQDNKCIDNKLINEMKNQVANF